MRECPRRNELASKHTRHPTPAVAAVASSAVANHPGPLCGMIPTLGTPIMVPTRGPIIMNES